MLVLRYCATCTRVLSSKRGIGLCWICSCTFQEMNYIINSLDVSGFTPLIISILHGQFDMVVRLIKASCNIYLKYDLDGKRVTASEIAFIKGFKVSNRTYID